jgi:hypothetical protein
MMLSVSRLHSTEYRKSNECGYAYRMRTGRGNRITPKKPATLSIINPTWSDLESNPSRRGRKSANNSLSYARLRRGKDLEGSIIPAIMD